MIPWSQQQSWYLAHLAIALKVGPGWRKFVLLHRFRVWKNGICFLDKYKTETTSQPNPPVSTCYLGALPAQGSATTTCQTFKPHSQNSDRVRWLWGQEGHEGFWAKWMTRRERGGQDEDLNRDNNCSAPRPYKARWGSSNEKDSTKYRWNEIWWQNMWNTIVIRGWAWVLRVPRAGRQHWQVFQHSVHISMIIRNIYYDNYKSDTGKCLNTIKTCESEQDRWVARFWKWNHVAKYTETWLPSNYPQPSRCLSTIRWSTTPYWTEGARKQYYITKQVAERAK